MAWRCWLYDTITGLIVEPIRIPTFTWTVDINSSTMNTTRDRRFGDTSATGLTVAWDGIPGTTKDAKAKAIASYRRSILVCWLTSDGKEYPVLGGAIGPRTDTRKDTSFQLICPYDFLDYRYLINEGAFGAVHTTVKADNGQMVETYATQDTISYQNLSQRAIACDVIRRCTSVKPGGALPIDLPYLGEEKVHLAADGTPNQNYWRTYNGYDVANDSCKSILGKLSATSYGPDMQFRPYFSDERHVRYRFVAGSDDEPNLEQTGLLYTLTSFPRGGNLQGVEIDNDGPIMRIYGTGDGSDASMDCHLSEDLTLCKQADPWPLMELSRQDTNLTARSIASTYDAMLASKSRPILQLTGTMKPGDKGAPELGMIWPGEMVEIWIKGHPGIVDGKYIMRLMELGGDQGPNVKMTFDIYVNPSW